MPTTDAAVRAISQHPTEHAEQCKLAMGSYSPQNLRSPNPKWFWQICHLFIGYFTIYTNSTDLEINISFSNIYYLLDVDSTDELLEYSSEPKLVSRMDAAHTHTHTSMHTCWFCLLCQSCGYIALGPSPAFINGHLQWAWVWRGPQVSFGTNRVPCID